MTLKLTIAGPGLLALGILAAVAGLGPIASLLVAAAVVVGLALGAKWAFWPHHELPRHRVRHQRIRLYLRLHPGRGHATAFELHRHWGRLAAARKAKYARPSLTLAERVLQPAQTSVMVGRAHYGHALRLPVEEHVVVIAPPRTGKTGWLSSVVLRYPGPVVSTTTRTDVHDDTAPARSQLGRVDVFNPQNIGRVASTVRFDPIAGCTDVATAIRRADAFALAVSSQGMDDGAFWAAKTSDYLRAFMFAAAFARTRGANYGLMTTAKWALGGASQEAEELLSDAGAHDWAAQLAELRGPAEKTTQTVRMYMTRALGFLFDPALAASVLPTEEHPALDLYSFVRQPNTLYMVASGQGEQSPLAPLFAALANEIHYTAGLAGSWSPGGRLPRPMLMALDEVTQICPVPLDQWMADSGGKGIQVMAVAHGTAQLRKRWGQNGARVILDTAGAQIILPGITNPETLQDISGMAGTVTHREHGSDNHSQYPVMTPAMTRSLPDKRALIIRGNRSPVICKIRQVWDDKQYKQAHGHRTLLQHLARASRRLRKRPALGVPVSSLLPPPPDAEPASEAA